MFFDLQLHFIVKLLLAAALGGAVGLERELGRRPAGLRTNMFICVGSALFTLLSFELAHRFGDPSSTRIVSNLIPGIGFLGAGAIIRERGSVVGLTTAATIFVIASIGMAVGAGMYLTAVFTTVLILVALTILGSLEVRFGLKAGLVTFRMFAERIEPTLMRAFETFNQEKVAVQNFRAIHVGNEYMLEFDAVVTARERQRLLSRLSELGTRSEASSLELPGN
jgi:putative Mg2+ transporter-C (MgtC) family protein